MFKIVVLKVWPDYFNAIRLRVKTFDVRAELAAVPGDVVCFREWSPGDGTFTGRHLFAQIAYQERSEDYPESFGLPTKGVVVSRLELVFPETLPDEEEAPSRLLRPRLG